MLNIRKLLFFAVVFTASMSVATAQSVFVYALPKTKLEITITVQKTTTKRGAFYQYSERYLATKDVITEEKIACEITDISVKAQTVPNAEQTYSLSNFDKKQPAYNISVDNQGILCGINIENKDKRQKTKDKRQNRLAPHSLPLTSDFSLLPLGEEYMLAGSNAKLVEGVAKQIYRIRESRLALLTGDVEHLPDGDALKTMLKRLDQMERELTEMFIGTKIVETETRTFIFEPENADTKEIIFRLSSINGIVPASDLSGAPFYINIKMQEKMQLPPADPKKKVAQIVLYHVLPVNGAVTIGDTKTQLFSGEFVFPQFGTVTTLDSDLLTPKSKVTIDNQTGRLLKIEN